MQDNIKKEIGIKINTLLALQNKKQKDLAKELGVSDNTISYFAKGERAPNLEQIIKMSKIFNVSTDYLLGNFPDPTNDMDKQFVCKYLGVSSKAIDNIKESNFCNEVFGNDDSIVDSFLSLGELNYFFGLISDYKKYYLELNEAIRKEKFKHISEYREKRDLYSYRVQLALKEILDKIVQD